MHKKKERKRNKFRFVINTLRDFLSPKTLEAEEGRQGFHEFMGG